MPSSISVLMKANGALINSPGLVCVVYVAETEPGLSAAAAWGEQ